jgi:hypothetical protein
LALIVAGISARVCFKFLCYHFDEFFGGVRRLWVALGVQTLRRDFAAGIPALNVLFRTLKNLKPLAIACTASRKSSRKTHRPHASEIELVSSRAPRHSIAGVRHVLAAATRTKAVHMAGAHEDVSAQGAPPAL